MKGKVTVEKTPNRAGATPLFRLSAAQKVGGVAPARHACCVTVFWPRAAIGADSSKCRPYYTAKEERRKTIATAETTIDTTKDYNPSGSTGGRSQTQPE
jgi:hypothetical protein